MNFPDILKSIEQAVYEITLWVIMIPKTVFKIIRYPSKIPDYVHAELEKDEKKQFADNMSPVILWLLLAIIPAYMGVKHFYTNLPQYLINKPENYLFYISMTLAAFLLTPALIIHLFDKKKLDRDSFKESFYIQCYLQSPVTFLVILLYVLMKYLNYDFNGLDQENYIPLFNSINGWKDIFMGAVVALFCFLAYMEYRVIKQTGKSASKTLLIIFLSYMLSGFIMLVTAGLGYVLFFGL